MTRTPWATWLASSLLAGGCILEPNPDFVGGATESGTQGTGATDGTGPSATMTDASTAPSTITAGTMDTGDTGTDTGTNPSGVGCDDPSSCTTYHIGPIEDACPHEVDGNSVTTCDFVGTYALRIAAGNLEFDGGHGLIVMHDNNGVTTSYAGSIDVAGDITIRAAEGLSPESVRVYSEGSDGVLRLRGDSVHLQGFTLVCRSGGMWAMTVRENIETQGTETGGHLIENMVILASRPETVGSNGIEPAMQSVGPQTIIRNNHFRGYFEWPLDMRFATDSLFSHNTVFVYQRPGGASAIDATEVDGLEISNNVFASLTQPIEAFVSANDATDGLVLVGNAVEGAINILGGLETTAPDLTYADNSLGPLEMESPRNPLVLADSGLAASSMGVAAGLSLDGVDLGGATRRVPGAYQVRSARSLPRPTVITVGDGMCGGSPCDVTKSFDSEIQRAVWSTWPGGAVEIYPSATPYSGPATITWPIDVRGMGTSPGDVVLRRLKEDSVLDSEGMWSPLYNVLQFTRSMSQPTVVEMLTIEAGPDHLGIVHEGRGNATPGGRHEIRRVWLRDDGMVAGDPADIALYIGDDVVVHDVLVHGGYDTCVRFGPRPWEGDDTPPTTAYVHHLSCRLTEPTPADPPIAAFEVASVSDSIIADVVVELAQPGPLFRAQRRNDGSDLDPVALDVPLSFTAHSISARGHGSDYDGFSDLDGSYTLTAVDTVGVVEPLFVDAVDSHLAAGALAIDGGIDPTALEPGLSLGVTLDGVDRSGHVPDRGCYEQGM